MRGYMKVAEQLLISRIMSNGFPLSGKSKTGFSLMALSGLMLAVALGFFVYAAHLWFAKTYEPEVAALFTAAIALGLSVISLISSYFVLQYRKFKMRRMKDEITSKIQSTIDVANDEFGDVIQDNPKAAVALASVAGFLAGEKLF